MHYDKAITSFEPSPPSFRRLTEAAAADPLWSVVNLALGARPGVATFHGFGGDGQFDSLRPLGPYATEYSSGLTLKNTASVAVQRLDAVWPDPRAAQGPTLLKIDTQGFDLEVIEGAGELLGEIPAVLMEVAVMPLYDGAPVIPDVLSTMAGLGFELTGAFPIHRYASGLRVIEFDCTFVNLHLLSI